MILLFFLTACAEAGNVSDAPNDSGVRGRVVSAPTCPVETGDPACEPRPVEARVTVTSLDGSTEEAVPSDVDGTFAVGLPPGEYEVSAEPVDPAQRLSPRPIRVTVNEGVTTRVTVVLDTGIRAPG